jgi:ADP-ribose pyrophosphatase YjhB (NUDIX family)
MSHIRVSARALIIENEAILLVEFDDETGLHYNLPGGGVEPGESLVEALEREAREEASVDIEVGPLVFVVEYEPNRNAFWASSDPALSLIFDCRLSTAIQPRLSDQPDPNQTAVKWIELSKLETVELLPHLSDQILEYVDSGETKRVFWEEPINPERVQRYLRG